MHPPNRNALCFQQMLVPVKMPTNRYPYGLHANRRVVRTTIQKADYSIIEWK